MLATNRTAQSGIYQIRCLVDGRIYVGGSVNLHRRWRDHRKRLLKGLHHSRYLQRTWQKYGAEQFVFEVLEIVLERSDLVRAEQEWIDRLRPFDPTIGFNARLIAESNLGTKGHPCSDETRAKLSVASKGQMLSPEMRARISATLKGHKASDVTRARMSAAQKGIPNKTPQEGDMPQTKTQTKPLVIELDRETRQQLEWLAERAAANLQLPGRNLAWTVRRLIKAEWQAQQDRAGRKK